MDNIRQSIAMDMGEMMIRIRELEAEGASLRSAIAAKDKRIIELNEALSAASEAKQPEGAE